MLLMRVLNRSQREGHHGNRNRHGQDDHGHTQHVGNQDNAVGRGPIAHPQHDNSLLAVLQQRQQTHNGQPPQPQTDGQAHPALKYVPFVKGG